MRRLAFWLVLLTASPALADEMPNVLGQSEARAVRTLEAKGLEVRVVTIAGASPGRVAKQIPAAGRDVHGGDTVELHVGVRVNIKTIAPRVTGMTEERAVKALSDTYFLVVEYVKGFAALEGRVLSIQELMQRAAKSSTTSTTTGDEP